jgi:prephenate dehydrogenase
MQDTAPGTVAIFGPGLLGGSIALALRKYSPEIRLRIWARRESSAKDLAAKGIESYFSTDAKAVCKDSELIVLCTPVQSMPQLAHEIAESKLEDHCVVTDVGSVKTSVVAQMETIFARSPAGYIGSHPMAGSESAGLAAARADLFKGAACILTPTLFTAEAALSRTRFFWQMLGAHTLEMSPEEHDRKIARISHLPHLIAAAVTRAALLHDASSAECAGNGFRDATRIAAGDPDLWTGIVQENRAEIIESLRDARDEVSDLLAMLEKMDDKALRRFLAEAKALRDQVP